MADEITYSGLSTNYTLAYKLMSEAMISSAYAHNNLIGFMKRRSIANFASTQEKFPKPPKLTAGTLTDGTDMANTAFTPTSVPLTVAEIGLMLTLTDLARFSNIEDLQHYGSEAGKAVAEKITSDIAGLGAGLSQSVGTSTSNLTEQNLLDAKTTLTVANIPGPYFAVLHPQQENDAYVGIGTTISGAATTGTSPRDVTNDLSPTINGAMGSLYGVTFVTNSEVPTANAGADRQGYMAAANRMGGYLEKWAIRPEMERDASLRGTEVVVTAAYAVGEIDDASGVAITTDA